MIKSINQGPTTNNVYMHINSLVCGIEEYVVLVHDSHSVPNLKIVLFPIEFSILLLPVF